MSKQQAAREQQASKVWSDLDLQNRRLYERPALGKTKQEARGRVIPVTPHLVELVEGWDRSSGHIIRTDSPMRKINNPTLRKRWEWAGIDPAELRQPTHAFRKMFVSELRKAGVDLMVIKALVGHKLDMTTDV